jgi:hypothetical protein
MVARPRARIPMAGEGAAAILGLNCNFRDRILVSVMVLPHKSDISCLAPRKIIEIERNCIVRF